jgi:hypothetical protein
LVRTHSVRSHWMRRRRCRIRSRDSADATAQQTHKHRRPPHGRALRARGCWRTTDASLAARTCQRQSTQYKHPSRYGRHAQRAHCALPRTPPLRPNSMQRSAAQRSAARRYARRRDVFEELGVLVGRDVPRVLRPAHCALRIAHCAELAAEPTHAGRAGHTGPHWGGCGRAAGSAALRRSPPD